jgi:hypothetical protein
VTNALLVLALLLQLLSPGDYQLARRVQGEAGICPRAAQVAAAYICQTATCYGDAEPSAEVIRIVANLDTIPNPVPGARFLLSDADVESGVLADVLGPEVAMFECEHGYRLHAYAKREPCQN